MNNLQPQLVHSALGLVGGAVGTVMMQQGMKAIPKLPEGLRPDPMLRDPAEVVVGKAESLLAHPLPDRMHRAGATLSHYVYGAGWSAALGLALGSIETPLRRSPAGILATGAALGALVWAVGYAGWLPAAGITRPLTEQKPGGIASGILSHVLYGIVATAPLAARAAFVPERRSIWRRVFG